MNLKQVILVSSLGAMFSLLGCILLFVGTKHNRKIIHLATPFAAGALLSAVFLDLLKDGLDYSLSSTLLLSVLVGILLFFLAERFLDWFHHNHESLDSKRDPSIPLIIVGNGMHNALDGVAIAAAFLINVPTGIVTTFAVAIHEVPHNAADFGLLVHKNLARARALIITMLSNFATVIVAVIVYSLGTTEALPVGVLLGLSAGFLLYIALSDIIPDIHDHASNRALFDSQVIMLLMGVIVVGFAIEMTHILVT